MKKYLYLLSVAVMAVIFAGCAEPPTKEINDAKSAIDAVVAEGGEVYAANETRDLTEMYADALKEVKAQEDKTFGNFDKAKEMLSKVVEEAAAVEQVVPTRKETAKKNAEFALNTVETNIEQTASLLSNAPKGKGSDLDVLAMQQDLMGLKESLADIRLMIQSENYLSVPEKVAPIQTKVTGIESEVKAAMEKQAAIAAAKKQAAPKKLVVAKKRTTVKN